MNKYKKKNGKIYETQEKVLNKKALKEKKAILKGKINLLQTQIDDINKILE